MEVAQKGELSGTGGSSFYRKGLSEEEIIGNIWTINFAGHDTTANTLAFVLLLLATYQDVHIARNRSPFAPITSLSKTTMEEPQTLKKPSLWVSKTGTSAMDKRIARPQKSVFMPWSAVPQNCPGLKISQVKFVAAIASILCDHRLSIIEEPGGNFQTSPGPRVED
ncbi:uncharacterized protein BDW43DRAFT_313513 [Aspergillus alliaceus]|uniref:uncharacterized protein n=1 Tax=Petromyces alliaceus TaxID=209559 RepID=UPI0012A436EF|nr:uncharacterized protein BDW43DRAFT_313513 [Aspergillus alliaceus]KAB8230943.1 hypothetical protein BDW43DRAFT_313513 [Aspergillus alliaceus]